MSQLSKADLELAYLYFDMAVSRSTGLEMMMRPSTFSKVCCAVGLHQWGFTSCRACGKPDEVLRSAIRQEFTPTRLAELRESLFGTRDPEVDPLPAETN